MASNTQLRSLETTISSPNMQYKAPVQQYRALFARDYAGVFTARDYNTTPNIVYQALHNDTKFRSRETTILSPTMQYQAPAV